MNVQWPGAMKAVVLTDYGARAGTDNDTSRTSGEVVRDLVEI